MALGHAHHVLAHAIERGVDAARACTVEVEYIIKRVSHVPRPAGGGPDVLVTPQESGGDVDAFSQPNHPLIVIADADAGRRKYVDPLLHPKMGEFKFVLRPRGIWVMSVEANRMPIYHVADEDDLIALVLGP